MHACHSVHSEDWDKEDCEDQAGLGYQASLGYRVRSCLKKVKFQLCLFSFIPLFFLKSQSPGCSPGRPEAYCINQGGLELRTAYPSAGITAVHDVQSHLRMYACMYVGRYVFIHLFTLCVCVCAHVPQHICGSQRPTYVKGLNSGHQI